MAKQKNLYSNTRRRRKRRLRPVPIAILLVVVAASVATVAIVMAFSGGSVVDGGSTTSASAVTPSSIMKDWSEKQAQSSQSQASSVPTSGTPVQKATHDKVVPPAPAVDLSYFADALFIGDSRTEGFMMYSGVDNATYFAYKGLSVKTAFTKAVIQAKDGSMQTVENALKQQSFGKVYIMLGINEIGWPNTDVFIQEYGRLIDAVKATSPDAVIYIQLIMPVSDKKAGDPVYNNENINRFNALIKTMVLEKQVYFVNPGEAVSNEKGELAHEATTDGIHLNKEYCMKWRDYLMAHTVQK